MSVRRLHEEQPESFAFTPENDNWATEQLKKFPEGRQASAVIPLLWRVQEQEGWVTEPAIRHVAERLDMPFIRVLEVATFYTMFQLAPVGTKAHVQVCGTTPCMLRGSDDIKTVCKRRIAEQPFTVSEDGAFSWEEVECLGACVNAPMVLIGSDTYEDLTAESFEAVLDAFQRGETPTPGPQVERQFSEPIDGATSLHDISGTNDGQPSATAAKVAPTKPTATPAKPASPKADKPKPAPVAKASAAPSAEALAEEERAVAEKLATLPKDASAEDKANAVGKRPRGLKAPRKADADDLKRIKGIGKVNEAKLNELGIWHFDQIEKWNRPQILWVGTYLSFPGRIDREDWVAQAATLAAGGETDFSKRVDDGEVASSAGGPSEKS
ncbi:MAG: NADH-quinone oxidoreductase subunit NuoE [Pseudomonadota bacterium]